MLYECFLGQELVKELVTLVGTLSVISTFMVGSGIVGRTDR